MRETTDAQQMQIILNAIEQDRKDRRSMRRLIIICATVCLICVMAIGGLFIAFASGLEITTTTENTSVTYATMATQELNHVDTLHAQVVRVIQDYRAKGNKPPEAMMAVWDWEHESMVSHTAKVKMLLEMYRK